MYVPGTAGIRGFQASRSTMTYKLYVYQVHALNDVLDAIATVITSIRGPSYGTDDTCTPRTPPRSEQQSPPDMTAELAEKVDLLAGNLNRLTLKVDWLTRQMPEAELSAISGQPSRLETASTAGIVTTLKASRLETECWPYIPLLKFEEF